MPATPSVGLPGDVYDHLLRFDEQLSSGTHVVGTSGHGRGLGTSCDDDAIKDQLWRWIATLLALYINPAVRCLPALFSNPPHLTSYEVTLSMAAAKPSLAVAMGRRTSDEEAMSSLLGCENFMGNTRDLNGLSKKYINWAPSTLTRRDKVMKAFMLMHKVTNSPWPDYVGREFEFEGLCGASSLSHHEVAMAEHNTLRSSKDLSDSHCG